jgi:multidrug efflux pump subunit AcrA (membrane-fusion protein)
VASVVRRPQVEEVLYLTGELRATRAIEIRVPLVDTWQVQIKWLAEDGSTLSAGDPIVEFDTSSFAQTIEEKRLRVTQAEIEFKSRERTLAAESAKKQVAVEQAEIEEQKARLEAEVPESLRSRREWHQKQSELHEKQAARDKAERDRATAAAVGRAEIENLRIALEKARRDLEASQTAAGALAIRAPRPGILVVAPHWQYWSEDRKLQIGDTLYPSLPVASIPDLSEMFVDALLPEVDEGRVSPGQPARCVLDTYAERVFTGKVATVSAVAEQGRDRSGFRVRVALDESDGKIMRPGMAVRVEVVRSIWKNVLVVPRSAVSWSAGGASIVRDGAGTPTGVRLGSCTPTECIVEAGLAEGDRVSL